MPPESGHSDTTTDGVRVRVAAQYLRERSDPDRPLHVYAYRVMLSNVGASTVRLLSRHWLVTDAVGRVREVRGPGVVGEHPELAPGERFAYTSGSSFPTEWGTMEGSYRFGREDGTRFDAEIGRFFLAPNAAPIARLEATTGAD